MFEKASFTKFNNELKWCTKSPSMRLPTCAIYESNNKILKLSEKFEGKLEGNFNKLNAIQKMTEYFHALQGVTNSD